MISSMNLKIRLHFLEWVQDRPIADALTPSPRSVFCPWALDHGDRLARLLVVAALDHDRLARLLVVVAALHHGDRLSRLRLVVVVALAEYLVLEKMSLTDKLLCTQMHRSSFILKQTGTQQQASGPLV